MSEWQGWAIERDGHWMYAHEDVRTTRAYASRDERVVPVRVVEDEDGENYGWQDTGDTGMPHMIWFRYSLFSMCFPYGPEAEQKRGRGRIVRLTIVPHACAVCAALTSLCEGCAAHFGDA